MPDFLTQEIKWSSGEMKLRRFQAYSQSPFGIQGIDLSSSLWVGRFQTVPMYQPAAEAFFVRMNALNGVITPFYAHPVHKPRPVAKPTGFVPGIKINAIRNDNGAVKLEGLPADFVMSAGDFMSVSTGVGGKELLQVAIGGQANGSGVSPWIDITPKIRPGIAVDDPVDIVLPQIEMRLEPESLSLNEVAWNIYSVSFSAVQVVR